MVYTFDKNKQAEGDFKKLKQIKCDYMSKFASLGENAIQEKVIRIIEEEFNKLGIKIVGATCPANHPRTVVLELSHYAGEVIVRGDGSFRIEESELSDRELEEITDAILRRW